MPEGFPPLASPDSKILILGTMPSVVSLEKTQYYGHPQNGFWKLLYALWEEPLQTDYEERRAFLLSKGIALWDVLQSCHRIGSADAAIKEEKANDFSSFAREHLQICAVFFNSVSARRFYEKRVFPDPFSNLPKYTLPSSSPARAMPFEEKLKLWRPLKEAWDRFFG